MGRSGPHRGILVREPHPQRQHVGPHLLVGQEVNFALEQAPATGSQSLTGGLWPHRCRQCHVRRA